MVSAPSRKLLKKLLLHTSRLASTTPAHPAPALRALCSHLSLS
jgi:hypothetical protein